MDEALLERSLNKKLSIINAEIKSFIKKTGNQNITKHNIKLIEIDKNRENGNFSVSLGYYIEKLPEAGTRDLPENQIYDSKKANHTIFIRALLEFAPNGNINEMVAYNTDIRYCEINKEKGSTQFDLDIITGFHFDFDKEASTNHPIFHVQQNDRCCKQLFVDKKFADLNNYKFLNEDKLNKHNKFIRIPTPQMDIFSAILMIFADYIIHPKSNKHRDNFRNFIDKMEEQKISFDYSNFEHISPKFNKLLLHYWYPDYKKTVS